MSASGPPSSSSSWKNPSAQHMQKYGLVPLPDDFEPTKEEQILLDMYETIQKHERQAQRLTEKAIRDKLDAKEAEFQKKLAPEKKRNKRNRKGKQSGSGEAAAAASSGDEEFQDEDLSEEEDEAIDLHQRREAKLAKLREQVEEAKQSQKTREEDALRAELLQEQTEVDEGPALKRKKIEANSTTAEPSSLIAHLAASATPPHDFSKKLGLSPVRGKVLFPTSTDDAVKWNPPEGVFSPNDGAFVVNLDDFDVARAQNGQGNNTLAIKFMAPAESKRFSINIAGPDNDDFHSVLFHFNPRHHERGGQLIVNDKQDGIWGQAIAIPLSQVPLMFGQTSCTLVIQITGEGFDVFVEGQHCARLEHRTELPSSLVLQFPSTDDYGSPENWTVYKVWWGNLAIMAKPGDLSGIVAGVNQYSSLHPRKLFVSGLSKIFTEPEVDLRRAELERAFRKYGGDRGVQVVVPTNTTYAFVETESERQADLALTEMAGQYRLNRARRTRHEALQEERAAAEAAKGAAPQKESSEWD